MNTATVTQIKTENSLEVVNQFGIELDLDIILDEELFELGLASDIGIGI